MSARTVWESWATAAAGRDLRIYPQSRYVVAVLSNLDPPAAPRVSAFLDPRLPK